MGKISVLSQELVNQIAAGEVVERPVSVVKELVENSLDAGARSIRVELIAGGTEYMSVLDDGDGIEEGDLWIIAEGHSTSKIRTLDDIYKIMTFWFRWEALASIASVSDFEIQSALLGKLGKRMYFQNGQRKIDDCPMDKGTKIIVKNLFARTPARLNYLKSEKTEQGHIVEFLENMALFYPHVTFECISSEKRVFYYPATSKSEERIFAVYGQEFLQKLLPIQLELFWMKIEGFISDPKYHFLSKNRQTLAVNGRLIKSPTILKALTEAYNRYIPHGTYPAYILHLSVNPEEIDVNVHPRKQEIRFAHESEVYRSFYSGVSGKLDSLSLISSEAVSLSSSEERDTQSFQQYYTAGSGTKFKSYSPYKNTENNPLQGKVWANIDFNSESSSFLHTGERENMSEYENPYPNGRVVGQLWNSYILVEKEKQFLVLDQHALAERVIYERLVSQRQNFQIQKLLLPQTIALSSKEVSFLEEFAGLFHRLWFEWEALPSGILVSALPDFVKKEELSSLISWIISDVASHQSAKSRTLEEIQNKIYAYAACRSAIKFWQKLSQLEMEQLLVDAELGYSSTCPHGRPVIYELGLDDFKGKFER